MTFHYKVAPIILDPIHVQPLAKKFCFKARIRCLIRTDCYSETAGTDFFAHLTTLIRVTYFCTILSLTLDLFDNAR